MNKLNDKSYNIIEALKDSIVIINISKIITLVNQATLNMFGYKNDELIGASVEILLNNDEKCNHKVWLDKIVKSEPVLDLETECITKDGNMLPVIFSGSYTNSEQGDEYSIVCVIKDISGFKDKENKLEKAIETAKEASSLKNEYLAKISYEIRNHMNTVEGMTNMIINSETFDQSYKSYVDSVQNSATWMLTLSNDILDFSMIEAGKLKLEKIDLDLKPTIENVCAQLGNSAKAKGIKLGSMMHSNVPSLVRGDPWRLRQILTNLVSNAVKFTEKGYVLIQVSLMEENEADLTIRFTVSDTGAGIPAEKIEHLFKPYLHGVDTETYKTETTGLGLAISKQLCLLMGGDIGVESVDGGGAKFYFTLKLQKQNKIKPIIPLTPGQVTDLNVLIVTDIKENCETISHHFDSWGCKHSRVLNLDELPDELTKLSVKTDTGQLVVVDSYSPDNNAEKVALAIKNNPLYKGIRLILLVATANRGDAKRMEDLGYTAFLTKPITRTELYNCVASAMGFFKTDKNEKPELITRYSLTENQDRDRARILLVEDNRVTQMSVVAKLENAGFVVDIASNGDEAINTLKNHFYDAVLMDCHMPKMDGYEATVAIRELDGYAKHVPIIAITSDEGTTEAQEKCFKAGMDDYITKPIKKDVLVNIINKWLDDEPVPEEEDLDDIFGVNSEDEIFNEEEALIYADGNKAVLVKLVRQFIEDYPEQLANIKNAITDRNSKSLVHSAHALKGLLGNLFAKPTFNVAFKLERMGYESDFNDIEIMFSTLEKDIEELRVVLQGYLD